MPAIVKRASWGARPPRGGANTISPRPLGVAVHYADINVGAQSHDRCAPRVLAIQAFHQDTRGYADIAYSFLVCQHQFVFEGRGTGKGSAANGTTQGNIDYYAVCALIGPTDKPTPALLTGIGQGIDTCRAAGAGARVLGHRDLFPTACPGEALYALVRAGRWGAATPPVPPRVPPPPSGPTKLVVDGVFGPATKRRLQQWAGVPQDGILGPVSWRAIQRRVGAPADGIPGPVTWRAIQRLVGVPADGIPGPVTYAGLQRYLNSH
jgi:peptidoglycan hydrolase-like protein with peptidoglycan-binding domain